MPVDHKVGSLFVFWLGALELDQFLMVTGQLRQNQPTNKDLRHPICGYYRLC